MDERRNVYFYETRRANVAEKVTELKKLAEKNNFIIVNKSEEANIIVSVGGDGTFLQAVQKTGFREDCLYAGISIFNELNMYCDFYANDTATLIEVMSEAEMEVRRYPVLQISLDEEAVFYCLNEFSIKSSIIKTMEMNVYIDDLHFEVFRGDGMIIATPTGSTAYNKSVNGAVVDPLLPCMQVSELASLNNKRYRTLGSPFILSGERTLKLEMLKGSNNYPIMGIDNEALSIQHIEEINISLSDKRIKTLKLKDNSFWHKVKRAFL
ncbi:NAD kinase [Pseudobacillus wudalianchiensis]|uniref:NAD kinase n=1 Tax=Pseudobacillus wudalianchiensis TaxID=1743143 RepID=A0A1B9B831_9BACI|nr:NAD kinase [Bacillus wudalianchiensis]OCA92243.1 NAD kinase [Bacillus wudalianchiensis]